MIRSLPPFLLGVIVAAYWGRVLRMAYKTRQRTGRAANLIPAEAIGFATRVLWIPAVIVWVVHPFCAAIWRRPPSFMKPLHFNPWIAWFALLIAAGCFTLTLWCWKTMGQHWRMGINPSENNPIIATGPFAWVRHPIYGLSIGMMLCSITIIPSPLMLTAGIIHMGLLLWESWREERHLLRIHGEQYAQYQRRVGRFFPKVGGR